MNLFLQIQNLQLLICCMADQEFVAIFNHFLHCFIILLHFVFSILHIKSLLVPYAYASTESIDFILLSSFELKAISLISSVKWFLSILNLWYVFNINLLVFMNSLRFSLKFSVLILLLLVSLFYFQVELLLNSFHNL